MTMPLTSNTLTLIQGIGDIADDYDAFLLDIWGVLHDGITPFPGTIDCLKRLKDSGKKTCLVSNTPDNSAGIIEKLNRMGITRDLYDDIITAGDSAYEDIKTHYQGQSCWYAGDKHFSDLTAGLDLNMVDHPAQADFMINDLYALSDQELETVKPLLQEAADKGLVMICGNPDLVVNVGTELNECPGTYALIYEEMGGHVVYHGKPHRPIYETAWEKLGRPDKTRMIAVGDSLHTDIQGANGFDVRSVFNLAGIHKEEVQGAQMSDDIDTGKLENMIQAQPHRPNAVLNGFQW